MVDGSIVQKYIISYIPGEGVHLTIHFIRQSLPSGTVDIYSHPCQIPSMDQLRSRGDLIALLDRPRSLALRARTGPTSALDLVNLNLSAEVLRTFQLLNDAISSPDRQSDTRQRARIAR